MTWIFALPHSPPNEVVHRGGEEEDQDILPTTLVVEEKREESDVDNAKRRRLPKEHIDRQEKSAQKRKSPEEKIIGLSRSKRSTSGSLPQSIVSKKVIRRKKG